MTAAARRKEREAAKASREAAKAARKAAGQVDFRRTRKRTPTSTCGSGVLSPSNRSV